MEFIAGVLLHASVSLPHSTRAHHFGAAATYAALLLAPNTKPKLNKVPVKINRVQFLASAMLFAISSAIQPAQSEPFGLVFLPLFLCQFSDFSFVLIGSACVAFILNTHLSVILLLGSVALLSFLGCPPHTPCLLCAALTHCLVGFLTDGTEGYECGVYSAFARWLFLRESPLHLRGLLLLAPLALVHVLFAPPTFLLYVPFACAQVRFSSGRDPLALVCVAVPLLLTAARLAGLQI